MTPADRAGTGADAVDATEAIRLVASGAAWLLDVREDNEWRAGHAAAAHHIPLGELQARQEELPADEPILVVCHVGVRSRMASDALVRADYTAANIEGGMDAWRAAGGEIVL